MAYARKWQQEYYRKHLRDARGHEARDGETRQNRILMEEVNELVHQERQAYYADFFKSFPRYCDLHPHEEMYIEGRKNPRHRCRECRKQLRMRTNIRLSQRIPKLMKEEFYRRDGWVCLACGKDHILSIDHIIPQAKGGQNTVDNLQTLCLECNGKKGTSIRDYRSDAQKSYCTCLYMG
jgi:5-methylcytosine-specific restriction endonuclease McrA